MLSYQIPHQRPLNFILSWCKYTLCHLSGEHKKNPNNKKHNHKQTKNPQTTKKKPTPTNKPECKAPRRAWLHAFPRGVLNTGPQIRRVTCVWHAEPGEPGKGKEVTAQHYTRARCCSLCGAVVCHKDMRSNRCTPFSHFSFSLLQMLLTY